MRGRRPLVPAEIPSPAAGVVELLAQVRVALVPAGEDDGEAALVGAAGDAAHGRTVDALLTQLE